MGGGSAGAGTGVGVRVIVPAAFAMSVCVGKSVGMGAVRLMVMTVIMAAIMPAARTGEKAAHLPIEKPEHGQEQSADQHLNAEGALAYQIVVDAAAGVKPHHGHGPDEQNRQLQEQQKLARPFLFTGGAVAVVMPVVVVMRMIVIVTAAGGVIVAVAGCVIMRVAVAMAVGGRVVMSAARRGFGLARSGWRSRRG